MNFAEYQKLAMTTCGTHAYQDLLVMAGMGLVGEAGEVIDIAKKVCFHGHHFDCDKMSKEIGDVLWYTAAYSYATGIELDLPEEEKSQPGKDTLILDLQRYSLVLSTTIGTLSSITGSIIFQDRPFDAASARIFLCRVILLLMLFAELCGKTLEEIMEENIAKLKARYPEGFSTERSINRVD